MIPQEVRHVLLTLERAGHKAYIVGGCVRDMLMENRPHDWDVTTSALTVTPAQPLVGMVWLMVRMLAPDMAKIDR